MTTFRAHLTWSRSRLSTGRCRVFGCVGCSILNRSHGSRDRTSLRPHRPGGRGRRAGCGDAVRRSCLTEIRDRRAVIAEQEIATLRAIAEWAGEHVVADEAACGHHHRTGSGHRTPGRRTRRTPDLRLRRHGALRAARPVAGLRPQLRRPDRRARPPPPAAWTRVLDGQVPVWKALRIADSTRLLPLDAAGFVDRQLAPYAHGCTWAQVDRLVEEALVRYRPRSRRGTAPRGPRAPPRRPRPRPGRLRRHRPRHHRPGRRRCPRPRTSHRAAREAQRPARRHRLPRRAPGQSAR